MADPQDTNARAASPTGKKVTLAQRWQQLDGLKNSMLHRCEDYALWTLPYIFPQGGQRNSEMPGPSDSTGARAVNHLSNKLVMTLFQPHSPFFRLIVNLATVSEVRKKAEAGDPEAKEALEVIDKALAEAEKSAMQKLNYTKYRTEATTATKALIITGNALMYHPTNGGAVQCYSLRDYCVVRDLSGNVIEILTRDKKAFFTFSESIQDQLRAAGKLGSGKKYDKDNADVTIYTRLEMNADGKFDLTQSADDVVLDSKGTYTQNTLPWIPLTWNLVRGEDYGRGLVEDYAGSFHALHVLNNALINAVGIASDIKFLVDPSSVLDVIQLNKSKPGSYHSGKKDDIATWELNKIADLQLVESTVQRFTQQIAAAFLLNSSVQRDAERVTAEEIRYMAQELEMQHGGIYSRFADEWQLKTALLLLEGEGIKVGKGEIVMPTIITGLDSLSRAGDLDNLRMFVSDLSLLEGVPEEIRAVIDPRSFMTYIGIRRGVDYGMFMKTPQQLQQEAQARAQQVEAEMAAQGGADMAVAAGKEVMKEE